MGGLLSHARSPSPHSPCADAPAPEGNHAQSSSDPFPPAQAYQLSPSQSAANSPLDTGLCLCGISDDITTAAESASEEDLQSDSAEEEEERCWSMNCVPEEELEAALWLTPGARRLLDKNICFVDVPLGDGGFFGLTVKTRRMRRPRDVVPATVAPPVTRANHNGNNQRVAPGMSSAELVVNVVVRAWDDGIAVPLHFTRSGGVLSPGSYVKCVHPAWPRSPGAPSCLYGVPARLKLSSCPSECLPPVPCLSARYVNGRFIDSAATFQRTMRRARIDHLRVGARTCSRAAGDAHAVSRGVRERTHPHHGDTRVHPLCPECPQWNKEVAVPAAAPAGGGGGVASLSTAIGKRPPAGHVRLGVCPPAATYHEPAAVNAPAARLGALGQPGTKGETTAELRGDRHRKGNAFAPPDEGMVTHPPQQRVQQHRSNERAAPQH